MKKYLLLLATVLLLILGCHSPVNTINNQQIESIDLSDAPKEQLEQYIQQFEEATNDIDKFNALIDAAYIATINASEKTDTILQLLTDFTEKVPDSEYKIFAYNTLMSFHKDNNVSLSLTYFQKALELIPEFPEYGEIMKADLYATYAVICCLYGDYENTQDYLFEAISILEAQPEQNFQKIKDKTKIIMDNAFTRAYEAAVSLYKFYENQEKVDEYYQKLLFIAERTDLPFDKAALYLSYAMSMVWDEPDKALEYIEKGYKIGMDNQYVDVICKAYDLFSCYEEAEDNISGAIVWLEKCMEYLEGKQRPLLEMSCYNNLAYLYGLTPHGGKKLLDLSLKGLALADSLEAKRFLELFHGMLSSYYEKHEDYKKAYTHLFEYSKVLEKMKSEASIQQTNFLTARYDAERREMKIREMEEREKIHKIQLITGLSICIIIIVLLWFIIHLRNRRNRVLAEMNATKNKFFSIISHDLKNPALAQRDAIRQLVKNAASWNSDELRNCYHNLLKSADEEVELIYTLLSWAQIQTEGISYTPVTFDLPTKLSTDISLIRKIAESKKITLTDNIPTHAAITGDINMLLTVIRNLLTNAVKFTPVGGEVTLTIEPAAENKHTITINDTGIGMTSEELSNLFCIDKMPTRKGTLGEQGTGLGLIICKELLKKHDSALQIESVEGKGSRFWFEI